ncbi:MAG: 2-oxoglutarate ferredoxin oxidoreductase subunit beta [candidate division KSB1 bacterium]|nr:2-oxoglutarate ferredoxin oxidoreductase subunit beta [candidate division KSB1 bacterium]
MAFDYEKYLRMDRMPHMWCPGCGIGIVVKAMLRAIEKVGWAQDDVAIVSGIGCTSRTPGYVDFNTLHTTHGRALTFATGLKLARPDKHVIVISGDGDAAAIGGNHFLHACRRNIDITLIVVNNYIYGMTGGQASPTTPFGMRASTAPYGAVDPAMDICQVAIAAGATYVARGTVAQGLLLERYIANGLRHKGFSVIEAMSDCPVQYGRRNRMPNAVEMIQWIRDHGVPIARAKDMSPEELEGKFITGELHVAERVEYTEEYLRVIERAQKAVGVQA